MTDAAKRMYCPSCGEDVETFVMLDQGEESHRCFVCGAVLSAEAGTELKPLEMMLVAEDSMVFREVLKDKITELGISNDVAMAKDGEEFIALFTYRVANDKPISLAVLDIRMPGMNGVNAAMAMRAVEKGLNRRRPVPILFFSSVKYHFHILQFFLGV